MANEAQQPKDATASTITANAAVAASLPFDDTRDFDSVARGLVAPLANNGVVERPGGGPPIWDLSRYGFIEGDSPDSNRATSGRLSSPFVESSS